MHNQKHSISHMNLLSRRGFFSKMSTGISGIALATLLDQSAQAEDKKKHANATREHYDLVPRETQLKASAKSVIHLFMNGGPSQMDLFDPKVELDRMHGTPYFNKIADQVENPSQAGAIMRSPFQFKQHGKSGIWVSDVLPHLAKCVDEISVIKSMHTVNITHEPAIYKIQNGQMLPGHPSIGSWVTYGLGSENQNLPAYIVLDDPLGLPVNGTQNWQAGYLPQIYQGTRFRSTGAPILNLKPDFKVPESISEIQKRFLTGLDQQHLNEHPHDSRLTARIASYELAARMQISASDALDLSQESLQTQEMYGIGNPVTDSYGRRCLMARRLIERGVRFVQLYINGQIWDNHANLSSELKKACDRTDQPVAALLKDLKQRGLLDETLVLWGGEMGRLPIAQIEKGKDAKIAGRDHNKLAMCGWMAGGGVKRGYSLGATDELGFAAVEDRVSVSEWHATILHLLGLDHNQLAFHRNGLNEKLTGVEKVNIVEKLLA